MAIITERRAVRVIRLRSHHHQCRYYFGLIRLLNRYSVLPSLITNPGNEIFSMTIEPSGIARRFDSVRFRVG